MGPDPQPRTPHLPAPSVTREESVSPVYVWMTMPQDGQLQGKLPHFMFMARKNIPAMQIWIYAKIKSYLPVATNPLENVITFNIFDVSSELCFRNNFKYHEHKFDHWKNPDPH